MALLDTRHSRKDGPLSRTHGGNPGHKGSPRVLTFDDQRGGNILLKGAFLGERDCASMPVLKITYRLARIVALCVMVANLHGAAVAGQFSANENCPTVEEFGHRHPISVHHAGCCANLHCCPILVEPPRADAHAVSSSAATPILNEPSPFLLVRAFHPPPKPQFS
jgi:hypothetical protein